MTTEAPSKPAFSIELITLEQAADTLGASEIVVTHDTGDMLITEAERGGIRFIVIGTMSGTALLMTPIH
jgi:hypothetical protein